MKFAKKDPPVGHSPGSIFSPTGGCYFEKSVSNFRRWKDFAASGDEYNFISTQACELGSEWQGGGPPKTPKDPPVNKKSAKITENQGRGLRFPGISPGAFPGAERSWGELRESKK